MKHFSEKDKLNFINTCNESLSMSEAASKLNMHFNTFKKYAQQFGCYKPNQGGKGKTKNISKQ